MIIENGRIFGIDGSFRIGRLFVQDGKIVDEKEYQGNPGDVYDAGGAYVIPGLIDIHFHGCMGVDFCDGTREAIETISRYQASCGITAICPATMTLSEERLTEICRTAASYDNPQGSLLCGINMEGPYLSAQKCGAQNPRYIRTPDLEEFNRLQEAAGGLIRLVDIAPEETGAMEFIRAVKDRVHVSLAHTAADYDIAMEAFQAGADHVTHLYNAMTGFSHRSPGVVGAAADDKHCYAELICDGIHIHPAVVRTTFSMFGPERLVLISDSMEATGMPDGTYELGGQKVTVTGKKATLEDGVIAGSATNLMGCVRNAVQNMGIPLETAITCATINPAKSVGLDGQMGSLEPGKRADIVVLDEEWNVKEVWVGGKEQLPLGTDRFTKALDN